MSESTDASIITKRELPDGNWVCTRRMAFGNVRLSLVDRDPDELNCYHSPNFCYHDAAAAQAAVETWDGVADPVGWVRAIETGRRRPNGDASQEFISP